MTEKTVVAIGSSTDKDYCFMAPLAALFWREHIGYQPLLMLVGKADEWLANPSLAVVFDAIEKFRFGCRFIGRAEGYPDHSTAQNCRHVATALDIPDDTWVMPSDADLLPLRKYFYHQHEGTTNYRAVSYYSNGDHFVSKENVLERASQGLGTQTIPTCHVAMRAKDWRAIYQPLAGDVAGSVKKLLDAWMPTRVAVEGYDLGMHLWMADQQIMTVALCKQPWFPSGMYNIPRHGHPPIDRLDRCHPDDWARKFDIARWTDAHVHKAPFRDGIWSTMLKIIDAVVPQHSAWAREYRDEFVAAAIS